MNATLVKAIAALFFPAVVFASVGGAMAIYSGRRQALESSLPADYKPPNSRFGYSVDDIDRFWTALGPSGRAAERRFLLYDLTFPLFYGGSLMISLLWMLTILGRSWPAGLIVSPVVIAAVADWTENLVHLSQLKRYSDAQRAGLHVGAIELGSAATIVKILGVIVASFTLLFLFAMLVIRLVSK
ncbi:MAG: hypothetical protein ABJA98_24890 [Acidobacteriota bacterium]